MGRELTVRAFDPAPVVGQERSSVYSSDTGRLNARSVIGHATELCSWLISFNQSVVHIGQDIGQSNVLFTFRYGDYFSLSVI